MNVDYQSLRPKMVAFFSHRVGAQQDAEDLAQECLLRMHKSREGLKDDQQVTAWAFQIARNALTDYYRKRATQTRAHQKNLDEETPPQEGNLNDEVSQWLAFFLEAVPAPYREAVHRVDFEGLSQKQLAQELGLSYSGAKSRVQRGRQLLKDAVLQCCSLETDRRGNIVDYSQNVEQCDC